jgi:hypothetical protein
MAETVDVQAKLDEWLESNPAAQKYVSKLWYIPTGNPPPPEVSHTLVLRSTTSAERALTIGLVVKPEFAAMLDAILAMLATQPH